ncbi:hypothetical protein HGRIS_002838 [Hohenbuehelia grisea]|uniref:EthD domain-containing protein n=1 Tax=Hohenbuehelia grisea TaxID=104357 RepID=A0ABR3JLV0_9AGAR
MAPTDATGLLFVYGEPSPAVSEQGFNDWYDNEHIPARTTVPGFQSLSRYKAIDGQKPSWLAIYDLESPSVAKSDAYTGLPKLASDNERDIISRLTVLNRRIYSQISSILPPSTPSDALPGKYLLVVLLQPGEAAEDEFNRWYEEEHLKLLALIPGYLRGRRYTLVGDHVELAGKADASEQRQFKYLALHELDNNTFKETKEFIAATTTPWRNEVMKNLVAGEYRLFEQYKVFQPKL